MPDKRTWCEFPFQAMGGPCHIGLARFSGLHTDADLAYAAAQAIAEVARIQAKYSRYTSQSVVGAINAAAGRDPVVIDEETAGLFAFADQLFIMSEGRFDITSGVLRHAWDFKRRRVPNGKLVESLVALVDWPGVQRDGTSIRLPRRGMELDIGGFGKEYAADRASARLQSLGVSHGYVNLGGDIRVLGPQADGSPWSFGIQHPRSEGEIMGSIRLSSGALATSGDYERYFEQGGKRYCHVLDPRTGWPVEHWRSISVVAPVCSAAGALCTIVMLMQEQGAAFIAGQDVGYLAVDHAGHLHARDFPTSSDT